MNRKLVAILLCLTLILASVSFTAASSFTDVGTGELAMATAVLQGMGVVSGTNETTFDPSGRLTRAEACTMLVKMMGLDSKLTSGAKKTYFSDVPSGAWYAAYVNIAYSNGLINGYGNGKFGPLDPVTYGQMATILLRMLGYEAADVGYVWPSDYTSLCEDLQISHDFAITGSTNLTRGQAALMLYRSLTCKTKDSRQYYYQTVADVTSAMDVIVMGVNEEYNGADGLLLAYGLGSSGQSSSSGTSASASQISGTSSSSSGSQTSGTGSSQTSGKVYYKQYDVQSSYLQGVCGTLLLDASERVVGFLPDDDIDYVDTAVSSATLSALITTRAKYRVSASVVVLAENQTYSWSSGGYLHAAAAQGSPVRVYFDNDGTVTYIYIGSAAASSTAAAAAGISGTAAASSSGTAAASSSGTAAGNYTRYADYRVSGYIEAASPSLSAADSITVAGCSFTVLEDAVDALSVRKIGSRVTLLLSDDLKVAGVESGSSEMTGVLASDGKSVTLCGSGLRLSASEMDYDSDLPGQLVQVYAAGYGNLTFEELPSAAVSGAVSISSLKVGSVTIAPTCDIYEWSGNGYVSSLEGVRGVASHDFGAIFWTDTIPAAQVSWCHVNRSGQADIILLENVTGNGLSYGSLEYYTGNDGINLGSAMLSAYNNAALLTNGSEKGSKSLCTCSTLSGYVGVSYGSYENYSEIVSVEKLNKTSASGLNSCSVVKDADDNDVWQITDGKNTYRVAENIEVYYEATDSWTCGISAFLSALDSGLNASLYYDRTAADGGQIRIALVE